MSDPKFRPFFARAEQLGAFIMMHPNGFTHSSLHKLIFSGTLARFPDLKLMGVHGGGYLPSYSGRIDHALGHAGGDLSLPPSTYLRQVYLETVVFSYYQLAFDRGVRPDRIVMGTDYPFDMAEYIIRSDISRG